MLGTCAIRARDRHPFGGHPAGAARSPRWKDVAGARLRARAELVDVVAKGPRQAWAAGFEDGAEDREGTVVVERWDGTAWRKTTLDRELYVTGFDVGGPGDIWIVGDGVVVHGDGRRWSYPRPSGLGRHRFTDVSADRGRAVLVGTDPARQTSFAVEWTGRTFEKRATFQGQFLAVTARHGQVWVAGAGLRDGCSGVRPAVWHAGPDGTYAELPLPDVPGGYLSQVWAISPDDVWAVGGIGADDAVVRLPDRGRGSRAGGAARHALGRRLLAAGGRARR
ncbi:hypothetical protein ACFQ0B_41300 [Nonomuraea thailandensis]